MPNYIILLNWTDQGIRNVKDSPKRVADAKKAIENAGGKWLGFYYTMGLYDAVAIVELPSDEIGVQILLAISSKGYTRTTTLKAFTETEGFKIIEKLP